MNNLEDIKSRNLDLMAEFMYETVSCARCPCFYDNCNCYMSATKDNCIKTIKEWLLQESEEI